MRCNVGVNPHFLADQHLIAEYRELPMVIGSLRVNGWKVKGFISDHFTLGTGHINFFKIRIPYLQARHVEVKKEMVSRGYKCDALSIASVAVDDQRCMLNWTPTMIDSQVIRKRILEKMLMKPWWYRYLGKPIVDVEGFLCRLIEHDVYPV